MSFDREVEIVEARIAELREALVAVQMREWPDSRIMSLAEVYREWMDKDDEEALQRERRWWDAEIGPGISDKTLRTLTRGQFYTHMIESVRANTARSISLVLQYPVHVFYECGLKEGRYRWRGCRFGVNGSEYISGFGRC